MGNKVSALRAEVDSILAERNYSKKSHSLYAVADTIAFNDGLVQRKIKWYKWFGFLLLLFIPLLSTALSILLDNKDSISVLGKNISVVEILSYTLTLLTVLNSIFKPSERFKQACSLGIRTEHFKCEFLAGLEKMQQYDESKLLELCDKIRKDFVPYQEQLIGLFLPETAGAGTPIAGTPVTVAPIAAAVTTGAAVAVTAGAGAPVEREADGSTQPADAGIGVTGHPRS